MLQPHEQLEVSMSDMMAELDPIEVGPERRKTPFSSLTKLETRQVRARAGLVSYLGTSVSPFCSF